MSHVTSLADLPTDGLLTEAEVASYLRVSTASLKMNRYRGCGPASAQVGHRVRYTVGAVRPHSDRLLVLLRHKIGGLAGAVRRARQHGHL